MMSECFNPALEITAAPEAQRWLLQSLPDTYVDRLLGYVANQVEVSAHLQFYLTWIQRLLFIHGPKVKQRSQKVMATLRTLQKNVTRKYEDVGKL